MSRFSASFSGPMPLSLHRNLLLVIMAFVTTPLLVRSFSTSRKACNRRPSFLPQKVCRPLTFLPNRFCRMSSDLPATDERTVGKLPDGKDPKSMTKNDWRSVLSAQEYNVMRDKGTEYPGTGIYTDYYPKEGYFACAACGHPIYSADSKFKSGCGWPAFDKCYDGSISTKKDFSFGMSRIEIMCSRCGGHLGHVFQGERFTETNERHCVNSVSLKYVKAAADINEGKAL